MRFDKKVQCAKLLIPSRAGLALLVFLYAIALVMLNAPVVVAQTGPVVKVTVTADGQQWEWVTCQATVGGILNEAGVALGSKDRVRPSLGVKATQGLQIRITRIEDKVVVQKEPVKFRTLAKFDPKSTSARKVIQEGKCGEKEVKYLVTYKDGVKVGSKVLEAKIVKEPVDEIVSVSRGSFLASRAGSYTRSLKMQATAYDPGPKSCGKWASGYTAIGMRAGYGVVAVDPRVIPLRTKLYVEGYGFCVAGDVGGAIKGNRIDLGFGTYEEAIRYGRRRVTVYVLD